jgi:hypothetical protein
VAPGGFRTTATVLRVRLRDATLAVSVLLPAAALLAAVGS